EADHLILIGRGLLFVHVLPTDRALLVNWIGGRLAAADLLDGGLLLLELLDLADVFFRIRLELALAVVAAEADRLLLVLDRLGRVHVLARDGASLVDGVASRNGQADPQGRQRERLHGLVLRPPTFIISWACEVRGTP